MSLRLMQRYLSVADYLIGERESPTRYEYVDGRLYAMAGASDRHNRIAGNMYARLLAHLGDDSCEAFISDMKVKVDPVVYYYPDVCVCCDPPGRDPYVRTQPVLVIEVLSPHTARIDQHEKLLAYKLVPTLREYVLISQDHMHVEVHRRVDPEGWNHEILTEPDEVLQLDSVTMALPLADIYRGVRLAEGE